uniref:C2 domain-containing protein n=1 Tax=Esox lucius TaxID=8010 RepID=A0A3P8ZM95_ESOLU
MASSLLWCLLVTCVLSVVRIYGEERMVLKVLNLRASNLNNGMFQTPDGYVKVFLGPRYGGKTEVRNDQHDPWWKEEFGFFNALENDLLKLEVYDSDFVIDDLLGSCERSIKNGTFQHECFLKKGGTLHYTYTLGPIQQNLEDFENLEALE